MRVRTLLLLLVCAITAPAPSFARDWHINRFDAEIKIDADGHAEVTEHIALHFEGEYHGIYRTIPVNYPGPGGTNFRLILDHISAEDGETHAPLKFDSSRDGDYRKLKIYVPGAIDADKRVDIHYRVLNPVRHFDDYDEFYWNVTGLDWPVPINAASATLELPRGDSGLRAQAFTGSYGSTQQDATAKIDGSRVDFISDNPLSMREGMTIDVYIPKGIINQPSFLSLALAFIRGNVILLLPLLTLAVMFTTWYLVGRDPDPGLSVAPQYGPPEKMSPAEVGTLVDDAVDPRDITCTLIDLAVRGYIKIEDIGEDKFMFGNRDYILHKLKPNDANLTEHERLMLDQIFSYGGDQIRLSSLTNKFYLVIPMIKDEIMSSLKQKGMYRVDPGSAMAYVVGGVVVTGVLAWLIAAATSTGPLDSGFLSFACIGLSGIIVFIFARIMTAKTMQGARAWIHIKGFQEFMDRVETDRLKTLPPDTFEKFLPYAMALGVEQHWAKAFSGLLQQPPSWYVGPGYTNFNTMIFTNNLMSMSNTAHSTFVSAPRASSSGSGFSSGGFGGGGGFSGGGFGGGGGGAF